MKKDSNESNSESKSSTATFDNIGMTVKNLSDKEKDIYKVKSGILITNIESFSKAEDQRLFKGLVIVEADKNTVKDVESFKKIIENKKGKAVLLKVQDKDGNSRFVGLEIPE
jgi:S1-C subfamily serine protease